MKIAVVGGIGSGKSEVMKKVASMGAATLSADEINASLLTSPDYVASLQSLFPTAVKDGVVDKHALAEIVFADETARKALNALAHPLILKKIREDSRGPLVVEVPLILESGARELFDVVVFVKTPLEKRINMLQTSRGMAREDVLARINAQADESAYFKIADYTISNDSNLEDLYAKTQDLFEFLLK